MGFFNKIAEGLKKTRDSMMGKVDALLNSFTKIDEDFFDELEESLIMADVGAVTSARICENLRKKVKEEGLSDPAAVKGALKEIIAQMLAGDEALNLSTKPSIILVIGVNGVGKTTTIGKLAHNLHEDGKKVLLAAADTFRAAAIDQLQIWADRAGVDLVKHGEGSDPAAVVFDAINAGKARGCDVVICDTAGRLHNKKNLMDELSKIARVIDREAPGSAKEVLLVLDATTGQNALNQAKLFQEAAGLTGIILTKLDGTARGGVVIGIKEELNIPIKYIGVGEQIDDLRPFDSKDFVEALFEDSPMRRRNRRDETGFGNQQSGQGQGICAHPRAAGHRGHYPKTGGCRPACGGEWRDLCRKCAPESDGSLPGNRPADGGGRFGAVRRCARRQAGRLFRPLVRGGHPLPEKNARLIAELEDVPQEKRTARFVAHITCVLSETEVLDCEGVCEGWIGYAPAGEGGFGYDPIFYVGQKSFGQMSAQEKDGISHRGKALEKLYQELKQIKDNQR